MGDLLYFPGVKKEKETKKKSRTPNPKIREYMGWRYKFVKKYDTWLFLGKGGVPLLDPAKGPFTTEKAIKDAIKWRRQTLRSGGVVGNSFFGRYAKPEERERRAVKS